MSGLTRHILAAVMAAAASGAAPMTSAFPEAGDDRRASLINSLVGALPGTGAATAAFIAALFIWPLVRILRRRTTGGENASGEAHEPR